MGSSWLCSALPGAPQDGPMWAGGSASSPAGSGLLPLLTQVRKRLLDLVSNCKILDHGSRLGVDVTRIGPSAVVHLDQVFAGSAYFINPSLALTASYVINQGGDFKEGNTVITIKPIGADISANCEVIWESERLKVMLLRTDVPYKAIESSPLGKLMGTDVRKCEAIGFVRNEISAISDEYVATRVHGNIDPDAYPEMQYLVMEITKRLERVQGFAGSGMCVEGHLIGIITQWHRTERSFLAISISELVTEASLRDQIKRETGSTPHILDLHPQEDLISDTLKSVSRADPANIQEVGAAQLALSNKYYENVLAQARRSFNAAVAAGVVGLIFFLASLTFSLVNKQLSTAVVGMVSGGIVEVVSGLNFWLYSRTSVQLNAFHLRLERMQRFLLANSVSASLGDDQREISLAELVRTISGADFETEVPLDQFVPPK